MSTPFPERSSTTVIKMLYQVSEYSRNASKSGTETSVKIICLCDETRQEAEAVSEQTIADTVHSSVVRAADCRLACPWFNSGWRLWFTFMTWSSELTSQIIQMVNIKSPIRTITRKSVNMVAELRNGTEDYSAIAKATTATAVALDTKAFMVVTADPLSLLALKPSSNFGVDPVVDWMQWFRANIGTGGPAAVYLVTSLKQVHRNFFFYKKKLTKRNVFLRKTCQQKNYGKIVEKNIYIYF